VAVASVATVEAVAVCPDLPQRQRSNMADFLKGKKLTSRVIHF
jgi:hypothetical protein